MYQSFEIWTFLEQHSGCFRDTRTLGDRKKRLRLLDHTLEVLIELCTYFLALQEPFNLVIDYDLIKTRVGGGEITDSVERVQVFGQIPRSRSRPCPIKNQRI